MEDVSSYIDYDINDTIALLTKNYNKVMRRLNKLSGKNAPTVVRDNFLWQQYQKGGNFQRNDQDCYRFNANNSSRTKGILCCECEGFRHIKNEWPNFLVKKKRKYNATLFDDEIDNSDSDQLSNYVVFTASVPNHNSDDPIDATSSSFPNDNYLFNDDDNELPDKVLD